MTAPLAHLRVLDLTRLYPGAFCSLLLADLGARVTKVEAPGFGDGTRSLGFPGGPSAAHIALNRGKRSIILDLRKEGAAAVLARLVANADVVIESHKPGQLDSLGMGFEAMRTHNPAVVWCSITGFGDTGPRKDQPGHDITYLGLSGLLGRLGQDEPPLPDATVSIPLAASMAAVGILAAVTDVTRTGVGRRLDVNMTESAMWAVSEDVVRASVPSPVWGTIAQRNIYRCSDGGHVTVTATEPKSWKLLCERLGLDDLAGHRMGIDPDPPVRERLARRFAEEPAARWAADPGLAGGVGAVSTPPELLNDEHLRARRSITPIPGTDVSVVATPIRFESQTGDLASHALAPPPELGQQTDAVLGEAGFSTDQIDALRDAGLLG